MARKRAGGKSLGEFVRALSGGSPALMKVQPKYVTNGVKIVAITLDNAVKVLEYAEGMRIGYVPLISGAETLGKWPRTWAIAQVRCPLP
jgi:hypothetical protein